MPGLIKFPQATRILVQEYAFNYDEKIYLFETILIMLLDTPTATQTAYKTTA